MTTNNARQVAAAGWILILFAAGLLAQVRTLYGWSVMMLLAGSSLIILRVLWRDPAQTISQSIQEARR
jgi:hypothetical protein